MKIIEYTGSRDKEDKGTQKRYDGNSKQVYCNK